MTKRKKVRWSYTVGKKGRNRVRAYEREDGTLWLETYGPRERTRLKYEDGEPCTDRDAAVDAADALSAKLLLQPKEPKEKAPPLTLEVLLTRYEEEVTPHKKSRSIRKHDERARRVFIAFFDAQLESHRRATRHPATLDRVDWDRFIQWRRAGKIPGWEREVSARTVQYDLTYMVAALNWATGVQHPSGEFWLTRNPWDGQVRKAQRWPKVRELNPRRVEMTDEIRAALIASSDAWQFRLALIVMRETRRRKNAVRLLRCNDLDLAGARIRWRGEADKAGRESWTPMPERVRTSLFEIHPGLGIGDVPVFPDPRDETQPITEHQLQHMMRRAKKAAKLEIRGLGFHSEKRAGVRDPSFRDLPPALQERLSGTRWETLRVVYDQVSDEALEQAQRTLDQRRTG